ncbi:hypothetical protein M3Y94_00912600 [Aphelenchoides besseyi]|nr:hypothetical protein M3Y94_00912600 [Aphelenchoides besseyi]
MNDRQPVRWLFTFPLLCKMKFTSMNFTRWSFALESTSEQLIVLVLQRRQDVPYVAIDFEWKSRVFDDRFLVCNLMCIDHRCNPTFHLPEIELRRVRTFAHCEASKPAGSTETKSQWCPTFENKVG